MFRRSRKSSAETPQKSNRIFWNIFVNGQKPLKQKPATFGFNLFTFAETYIYIYILIITGVQASGVIIDRLLRQCCFVWSEIVGPQY